ncbi:hypothetical protein JLT2_39 [Paraglaciecola Antarctic JLT virus 2]|nr:hypothetical protein JLT2_39 [Paraglaciecola Antarctic JLT virus 2]
MNEFVMGMYYAGGVVVTLVIALSIYNAVLWVVNLSKINSNLKEDLQASYKVSGRYRDLLDANKIKRD